MAEHNIYDGVRRSRKGEELILEQKKRITRREFLEFSTAAGIALGLMPLGHIAAGNAAEMNQALLRLSWLPSGKDTVFYAAKAQGFWKNNGIDIDIRAGTGSADVCKLVGLARDDFGISSMESVIKARLKRLPVKMLGMHIPRPAQAIVSKADAGIKVPKDLEGKTFVGSPASAISRLLPAFLKKNGVDPSKVTVKMARPGAQMSLLLADKADAIPAMLTAEVVALKAKGWEEGKNLNIMRFEDWGFSGLLTLGFITSDKYIEKKRDLVKRFVQPCFDGIRFAMKNPEDAVNALLKSFPLKNKAILLEGLLASFKLMSTQEAKDHTLGWIGEEKVAFMQDLLYDLGQIKKKLPVTDFFTNEFLAGPPYKG